MGSLALYGSNLPTRPSRRSMRVFEQLTTNGQVRQTAVDVEADVTFDKIDAITATTGAAMGAVTKVAQAQAAMEQLVPQASGRLNFIADMHAAAMADELDRQHQRMRRL